MRGIYRRVVGFSKKKSGKVVPLAGEEEDEEEDDVGEVFGSDVEVDADLDDVTPKRKRAKATTKTTPKATPKTKAKAKSKSKSNVGDTLPTPTPKTPKTNPKAATRKPRSLLGTRKIRDASSGEGEQFDFGGIDSAASSSEDDVLPRAPFASKPSPKKKAKVKATPVAASGSSVTKVPKSVKTGKVGKRRYHTGSVHPLGQTGDDSGSGEFFDFDAMSGNEDEASHSHARSNTTRLPYSIPRPPFQPRRLAVHEPPDTMMLDAPSLYDSDSSGDGRDDLMDLDDEEGMLGLSQAMSEVSVASDSLAEASGQQPERQVIELSD